MTRHFIDNLLLPSFSHLFVLHIISNTFLRTFIVSNNCFKNDIKMTIRVKLYKYVYSLRLSKPIFDFESDYLRSSCRSVARMKVTRPGRPSKFFQTGSYRPAATFVPVRVPVHNCHP